MADNSFRKLFTVERPIIGMIHLAGDSQDEKLSRAMRELELYQEEGVNGAIIEDYHATGPELVDALKGISERPWNIKLGVNCLSDPDSVFALAQEHGAKFVQLDTVNEYQDSYSKQRAAFPNLVVLGGVRFKYQPPTGRTLEEDVRQGKSRCGAVVTTGNGTGIETPLEKLKQFKQLLVDFPLIVGAGVSLSNVYEQLRIADGAIIGSYFKPSGETYLPVDRMKVRDLMSAVEGLRVDIIHSSP